MQVINYVSLQPNTLKLNTVSKRREWLQSESKRIIFHYTPFHGSWLNMVEIWFGILNQKCLKESFDSPESMYNKIYAFINEWNTLLAHPFKWNYDGNGLHQKVVSRFLRILENSMEKLNVTFMTRQLLLMINIEVIAKVFNSTILNLSECCHFEVWLPYMLH